MKILNQTKMNKLLFPTLTMTAAIVLSACGGSGQTSIVDSGTPQAPPPPQNIEVTPQVSKVSPEEEARYVAYSESLYNDLIGSEPFALFFHANWCSVCQGLDKEINNDLASFPAGTNILKTDFDTELDLRKKYGIAMQSNIVVIDRDGNPVVTLLAPNNNVLKQAIEATL